MGDTEHEDKLFQALLDTARDSELDNMSNVISRYRCVRDGVAWQCFSCKFLNFPDDKECDSCGLTRTTKDPAQHA